MAYIAGAFEHPTRDAGDKTLAQLQIELAVGALADAGLSKRMSTACSAVRTRRAPAPCRWPTT